MEIQPFDIIHYPFEKETLERVVCPPYDKFTNQQILEFRNRDPHNFVWAILGDKLENHTYHSEAAGVLRRWFAEGVLKQESEPSFLVYRQKYKSPLSGEEMTRSGFYGLLRLPERDDNAVLPHERTFAEHKADRLKLYQAVRGTPEGIFVLYSDASGEIISLLQEVSSEVSFVDFNGHGNELGLLKSGEAVRRIKAIVEPQTLLIADGHHRFETGQNFRDWCREQHPDAAGPQPWDYILVYFTALEDPGLVILPTHRPLKGVPSEGIGSLLTHASDFFEIEEVPGEVTAESVQEAILEVDRAGHRNETLGLVTREGIRYLRLRDREKLKTLLPPDIAPSLRDLPVVWLHRVLLEQFLDVNQEEGAPDRLAYVRTGEEVFSCLLDGGYDLAFLLRGTRPEEVSLAAQSGERMPQKSTDFFPKVLSGLAVYLHP